MSERPRHKSKKDLEKTQEFRLDRRNFLKFVVIGSAVISIPAGVWLAEEIYTGEGNEPFDMRGEVLAGGELIDDASLAKAYLGAIETGRPVEADATIFRSTFYNAMRFFGVGKTRAEKRSRNVSLTEFGKDSCSSYACSYDTSSGLGMEITSRAYDPEYEDSAWVILCRTMAHEAYHLAVKTEDDRSSKEDYGAFGTYQIFGTKRGFFRQEQYSGGAVDLINQLRIIDPAMKIPTPICIPEEFFAELGSVRYFKHLLSLGLSASPVARSHENVTAYEEFTQGVFDIQDTEGVGDNPSWQEWWRGSLDIGLTDTLHYKSNRVKFYRNLGEAVLSWNENPLTRSLSSKDTAGLGVVAFADFANYGLTNYELLSALISEPVNPDMIVEKAKFLGEEIKAKANY